MLQALNSNLSISKTDNHTPFNLYTYRGYYQLFTNWVRWSKLKEKLPLNIGDFYPQLSYT